MNNFFKKKYLTEEDMINLRRMINLFDDSFGNYHDQSWYAAQIVCWIDGFLSAHGFYRDKSKKK